MNQALQAWHALADAIRQHPRIAAGIGGGVVALLVLVWVIVRLRRPSEEELERRRREFLSGPMARISDGFVVDLRMVNNDEQAAVPAVVFYSYRIAGVVYNCAQDVSLVPGKTPEVRLDEPVQVRYDPRNPGNSVLLTESWSGLWQAETLRKA